MQEVQDFFPLLYIYVSYVFLRSLYFPYKVLHFLHYKLLGTVNSRVKGVQNMVHVGARHGDMVQDMGFS